MKLSTKIFLGFAAALMVMIALSTFVFLRMLPVRAEVERVSYDLVPLLSNAGEVQFQEALAAYAVRGYSFTSRTDYKQEAAETLARIEDLLKTIDANFQKFRVTPSTEIQNLNASMKASFAKYKEAYALLPEIVSNVDTSLENIIKYNAAYLEAVNNYKKLQRDLLSKELAAGATTDIINIRADHMDTTSEMIENAAMIYGAVQDSWVWTDPSKLDLVATVNKANLQLIEKNIATANSPETIKALEDIKIVSEKVLNETTFYGENFKQKLAVDAGIRDAAKASIADAGTFKDFAASASFKFSEAACNSMLAVLYGLAIGVGVSILLSVILALLIIRSITKPVNILIETLTDGAHEVERASGQLSSSSQSLAEGASENAASLEETSAALEELSSMTRRNTDNTVEANALMAQASDAVTKAESSMSNVTKAMEEISISGNEIGKIIKTIDEIAFQTNLLALNAAVEAARAGEAGAGFAVVADEVRNLAIRSAEAAKNTAELIASTISNINSGSELVAITSENFQTVEEHASKVAELLAEVAEASKEQTQGIGQITTAMNQMDKVTQSTAGTSEEAASAAHELSDQAAQLLGAVEDLSTMVHGKNSNGLHHSGKSTHHTNSEEDYKALPF